jgi:hypothetical protein
VLAFTAAGVRLFPHAIGEALIGFVHIAPRMSGSASRLSPLLSPRSALQVALPSPLLPLIAVIPRQARRLWAPDLLGQAWPDMPHNALCQNDYF